MTVLCEIVLCESYFTTTVRYWGKFFSKVHFLGSFQVMSSYYMNIKVGFYLVILYNLFRVLARNFAGWVSTYLVRIFNNKINVTPNLGKL